MKNRSKVVEDGRYEPDYVRLASQGKVGIFSSVNNWKPL